MIYLLAYFRTPEEALHLAWSEDGLRWAPLNSNRPLLHATVGNRSIRDPFIRYGADGWFHLLSTDSWHSSNILHTRSRNLLHWEDWDVVPIMGSVAGSRNAWAPEFYYDARRNVSLVFWASVTDDSDHQRMWYAETEDFRTYTAPKILFDPGHSVIDATLVLQENTYYLIYKDERGENRIGTDYKAMRVATAADPRGPYTPRTDLVTPALTEGPTVFRADNRWLMLYDCFLENRWGASVASDLLHWEPVEPVIVPPDARHGTVFTLTTTQWQELQSLI